MTTDGKTTLSARGTLAARRRAAAASQPVVAEVALEALVRGNAIDAVAAGVLAAAAESASVLLGPVQILVGGATAGLRAIDGRTRQPGVGQQRPRGFVEAADVPEAARVATPALPAALAAALALGAGGSLARAVGPAVEVARGKSTQRAAVLRRLARRGAAALGDPAVRDELLATAGRVAGGLLGEGDFDAVLPEVAAAAHTTRGQLDIAMAPWRGEDVVGSSAVHVVAACDARGLVAIACYEAPVEGLAIEALGLVAPFTAAPVRRGETRVRPGEPRPASAPIALALRESVVELALGIGGASDAEARLASVIDAAASGGAHEISAASLGASAETLVAIARTREAARVVR
jgi:gamma-glutamyltranspeptidase/glutathione hydrolase